ncbi:AAA family ATPase [Acidithiobacillus ferriphilus]|uniref:AAA family ATPase n=1 Tax=Acidithiobacillus ferriphilus TaxID=1689834 RepID=UPI001C067309|nr:AAA family ATPase [Acidithiobacillus ferriphilus]MBU2832428.1 AAA family ATPase [Acidithiobacillus ferriphilus]
MKLEKLTLANFRGFDQIDLDFAYDVTVIAGVNGVGKSGVLKALTSAMSLALPKFTMSRETPLGLSDTDVQSGKHGLSMAVTLGLNAAKTIVDFTRAVPLAADKAESLLKRRDNLRFATRETKRGSKEEQDIVDEIRRIEMQLDEASDIAAVRILPDDATVTSDEMIAAFKGCSQQPLAVFYSTSRFLSRLPPVLPKTKKVDAATAYDKSLDQLEVSLNDFANWYRVVVAETAAATKDRLFQQLELAIGTFLPNVCNLALHEGRPPRFSITKSGQTFFLEQLSDGERGLLALVFDLTRRLAIANPDSDNPIAEGVALVLIDEIELHLHPKWQRDVLQRLRDIFKACQFVVTTHSPLVLGEVPARCVRFLEFVNGRVGVTVPTEAYGMDANRILQEFMGAPVRNRDVAGELKSLFELIDQERFDEARSAIAALERKLGEDEPELTRASSLIRFLEGAE